MRYTVGWICLLLVLWEAPPLSGQPVSVEGPVPETERITLMGDTPMDQALRVIQTFSNRAVVDLQHLTTPIGVAIDRQPWRQALDQIARHNGLQVVDRTAYLELAPVASEAASRAGEAEVPSVTLDSREVNISAVFFQAERSVLRELGVDWSSLSGGRVDVSASHLGASQVASDQFSVRGRADINRSISVDVLLKSIESRNAGEVLANPQVKVQSGKTGYIQVGSDFSVTTSDFAGNAITQFFSTGTILTVKPRILVQEEIHFVDLDVEAERSSLVDPVRNLISKTVARTAALLKDGEQTAIGGLYGQEVSQVRSGVPLLKDLPGWFFGLRYLFGFESRLISKTELVVLLKVDIVPSIRERTEEDAPSRKTFEMIRERRKAFEEMMKGAHPPDSLDTEVRPSP